MADDLRTRIAKALYGQLFWITTPFEDQPDEVKDTWLFEADIVIRELRLRPEYGHLNHEDSGRLYDTLEHANQHSPLRGETLRTRLISDWTDVQPG